MNMDRQLKLRIKRTSQPEHGESAQSYWQEFQVTIAENAYILDALEAAWLQDPSLMFRHSCHHASCGSCGIRIQGREGLACITPAFGAMQSDVLHLEPLHNFRIIADLVVDINPLTQKMERVHAHVVTEVDSVQRFASCIECGLCISACPISAINKNYLGAAVLAAAHENVNLLEVREQVEDRDGAWDCHGVYECSEVCPAGVKPASAIGYLRKDLIISMINRKEK
jgi:succinate dehydrogenase / fumarate reductase, iron-sulfur subunit